MKRSAPFARRFIDDEAAVDGGIDTDEDEEQDMQDPFIETNTDDEGPAHTHRSMRNRDQLAEDEAMSAYYRCIVQSADKRSYEEDFPTKVHSTGRVSIEAFEDIIRYPSIDDLPLWRVDCRVGSEEFILMSLFRTAKPIHGLRAAFTPGTIRGCIYLECAMNKDLRSLLLRTSGINRIRGSIKYRMIDPLDGTKLLTMKPVNSNVKADDWVQITRGTYKGDIGMVYATHNWGVEMLLIPRLAYHPLDKKQKRKSSSVKYPPKLFDPIEFLQHSSANLIHRGEQFYSLGNLHIEHGLVLKSFDYSSISAPVFDIPWSALAMFTSSGHPDIDVSRMPRQQEWSFSEGEKIIVLSSSQEGIIQSILPSHAEVELTNQGTHLIAWNDMRKRMDVTQYVCVKAGQHCGRKGWIIALFDDIALIVDNVARNDITNDATPVIEDIEVHVNCLAATDAPFHFPQQLLHSDYNIQFEKTYRHPWIKTIVLVTKIGHANKGDLAEVVNVLLNQHTSTKLRLEIRLLRYDLSAGFRNMTVDYDDVVEASTKRKLLDFFEMKNGLKFGTLPEELVTDFTGGATPMPTEFSSTPAWDPSSQTPLGLNLWNSPVHHTQHQESVPMPSTSANTQPVADDHVLLNKALVNIPLWVKVTDGEFKSDKLDAFVAEMEGRLSIRHKYYKSSKYIEPEWVKPLEPSATHDNGLLVVIKGEHCGKHVRRLHHKREKDVTYMILAVVNPSEGHVDYLTGEHLQLTVDFLCKVEENAKQTKLNKAHMINIRTAYRDNKL